MSEASPQLIEATLETERRYGLHGWHGDDGIAPELFLLSQHGQHSRWKVDVLLTHRDPAWQLDKRPAEVLRHVVLGLGDAGARRAFRGLAVAMEVWAVSGHPDDPMSTEVEYLLERRLLNTHPLRETARAVVGIGADDTRVYVYRRQTDDPDVTPEIQTYKIGGDVPDALAGVLARMLTV